MKQKMPIGIDDFKEAREGYYLVDKTYFIKDLIENHKKVTLFTRPRRFGKTLTMSMVEYFFSRDKREESQHLFSGMAIEKEVAMYEEERGKYPVVFISLKDCAGMTWEETYAQFQLFTQMAFQKYRYLLDGNVLQPEEKSQFQRFLNLDATFAEYQLSLLYLSSYLYRYTKVKTILLIDEYDVPLQTAHDHGFYERAIAFFRRWFSASLKGNENLNFAVLTGVLRIAKESIFSGLNNLAVYSCLSDTYSDIFGFTTTEVRQMVQDLGYGKSFAELKHWYDGYQFGHIEIYNPWSVISYFDAHGKPAPYWVNTSTNSILKEALQYADVRRLQALQSLMEGKQIRTAIDDGIMYENIGKQDAALYTLMLNTGYLKAVQVDSSISGIELYDVMIPNEEIRQVYRREILDNIAGELNINSFMEFQQALLLGNGARAEQTLQDILLQMVSIYDTRSPEAFYHGFLLGMTCLLQGAGYQVESNKESGTGRFDIAIFPTDNNRSGVIMEFKVASEVKYLASKAVEALRQIEEKRYETAFVKRSITTVWKYGIAFCGKQLKIVQA